jgi:FkbH-like protein
LTTKRYTEEDIIKFSKSNDFRVISIRLIDKFGDSGLTGVAVIDKKNTNKWRIDTFLLSCRILGRRAEEVLLAYIIKEAKMKGVRYVYGHYINSLKNAPAKNFYGDNGFKKIDSSDEMEVWKYDTKKEYSYPDFINYKIS